MDVSINMIQMDSARWVWYFAAALLGGLASSLINNKGTIVRVGWTDAEKTRYRVGIITDVVAGFAAAMGILWMMTPQTDFQLIGIGAVSGYGGSAILQAMLNRLMADVSEKEKDQLKTEKTALEHDNNRLESDIDEIIEKEKELDKNKVLMNIMEKIARAKTVKKEA